jgi:hypothetical protein
MPIGMSMLLCLAVSCQEWRISEQTLDAKSATLPETPNCTSCHPYPPQDVHHEFHMFFKAWYTRAARSYPTCRDCHAKSIQGDTMWVQDTTFWNPRNEAAWFSWFNPDSVRDSRLEVLSTRTLAYIRALPVKPEPLPIRLHGFREWKTGPAHLNGVVDVEFDQWIRDTTITGEPARYDPEMQTCSAIHCHAELKSYRWSAPSKGLGPLNGSYPDSI